MKLNEWIIRQKTINKIYILYSPFIFLLFTPLTSFYGNIEKIWAPILLILWIQALLYYFITHAVIVCLIEKDKQVFSIYEKRNLYIHGWVNFVVVSIAMLSIIQKDFNIISVSFLFFFSISDLVRTAKISKLIVSLEQNKKIKMRRYFLTFLLVSNPYIGIWNLDCRVKRLLGYSH